MCGVPSEVTEDVAWSHLAQNEQTGIEGQHHRSLGQGCTWCPSFTCSGFHRSILWAWSSLQPRVRAFTLLDILALCSSEGPVSQGPRCLSGELLPLVLVLGQDSSLVWPGLIEERI